MIFHVGSYCQCYRKVIQSKLINIDVFSKICIFALSSAMFNGSRKQSLLLIFFFFFFFFCTSTWTTFNNGSFFRFALFWKYKRCLKKINNHYNVFLERGWLGAKKAKKKKKPSGESSSSNFSFLSGEYAATKYLLLLNNMLHFYTITNNWQANTLEVLESWILWTKKNICSVGTYNCT